MPAGRHSEAKTSQNSFSYSKDIPHPIRLYNNRILSLRPKERVQLNGHLRSNEENLKNYLSICALDEETLPDGVEVTDMGLLDHGNDLPGIHLTLMNTSDTTKLISSDNVLAHLKIQSAEGDDYLNDSSISLDGLVGPACEADALINGIHCKSLLDSGSQVTTLCRSFYESHLKHMNIRQLEEGAFKVEGAGGQSVPYDGFVNIRLRLPETTVGTREEIDTWALICPDTGFSKRVPLIVGTNTFSLLSSQCFGNSKISLSLPVRSEVAFAYRDSNIDSSGKIGDLKIFNRRPVKIQARCWKQLRGVCRRKLPSTRDTFLIQQSSNSKMPEGIVLINTLSSTKDRSTVLKAVLYNQSDRDIILDPHRVQAEVHVVESTTSLTDAKDNIRSYLHSVEENDSSSRTGTNIREDSTFEWNFDESIPEDFRNRVIKRLESYGDVFSKHEFDVGLTTAMQHEIKLEDGPVIRERPRPVPARDFEDARRHIQSLLDANIIKPSTSPYASPMVLVRKKSGKLRLCVDYRKVNLRTIGDSYPIPKISDIFSALHGSRYFSCLDLKQGFHQVPMAESSKEITAFVCPFGLFEFERMSQGLKNSPLTFQRLMEKCVGDMNLRELLVYLDDLIIHGKSLDEAEERLFRTLDRLRAFGLKLDPKKCKFFQTKVTHLGHVVTQDGIFPDPEKISALTTWPVPVTLKELKAFLGFVGYFRCYVKDFSSIVKPLNDLTSGYIPLKTLRRMKERGKVVKSNLTMRSRIDAMWTEDCQKAFDMIVKELTSQPLLGFADKSSSFILHTDASNTGLGACLYQQQGEEVKIIAYGSRGLSKSEANYPAHKKEFLALKWAVTDKFHDYLYGSKFTVVTDNNPLTYVLSTAKLDATGYRWLAALSVYDFDLKYKKGSTHLDADGLSRRPHEPPSEDDEYEETMHNINWLVQRSSQLNNETIENKSVDAIVQCHGINVVKAQKSGTSTRVHKRVIAMNQVEQPFKTDLCLVEALSLSALAVPDALEQPVCSLNQIHTPVSPEDWVRYQNEDPDVREIKKVIGSGNTRVQEPSIEMKVYLREKNRLKIINNVLYRNITDEKGLEWRQLVIPKSHRNWALYGVHDEVGHRGAQTTLRLARQRFFWPFMSNDIEEKCQTCERCVRRKTSPQKAPMASIQVSSPLELVCMDFLSIEPDGKGVKDVLVITDHFTKYAIAVPTKNQTAKVVAEALWDNLISIYGWPERLHSDQGRDFQSKVIVELCKIGNITKSRTTPYHPQGNPVERYNRTLLSMLGTLHQYQKADWRKYVKPLTHAYNCAVNETTGFTPYFLMFGRHAKLPIDLAFGTDPDVRRHGGSSYVNDLKERLKYAYEVARKNTTKSQLKNQTQYNKRAHAIALETGDRVLVRKVHIQGKQKLANKWEDDVYIVKQCMPGTSTYVVQDEANRKPARTLHRNLLLPIGALSALSEPEPVKERKMRTRSTAQQPDSEVSSDENEDVEIGQIPSITLRIPDQNLNEVLQNSSLRPEAEPFIAESNLTNHDDEEDHPEHSNDNSNVPLTNPQDIVSDSSTSETLEVPVSDSSTSETLEVPVSDSSTSETLEVPRAEETDTSEEDEGDTVLQPDDDSETVPKAIDLEVTSDDEGDDASQSGDNSNEIEDTADDTEIATGSSTINETLGRSQRIRQPPNRMTFDVLGKPTAQRYDMNVNFIQKSFEIFI